MGEVREGRQEHEADTIRGFSTKTTHWDLLHKNIECMGKRQLVNQAVDNTFNCNRSVELFTTIMEHQADCKFHLLTLGLHMYVCT